MRIYLQESKATYLHTLRNSMKFVWSIQELTRLTSLNDHHTASYYLAGPRANATRGTLNLDGQWKTNVH